MVTIFAPSQVNVPRLRDFACVIADVNMEDVEKRYADGITGTRIRNQFYYDLMRCKPHYPGTGNVAAPGFVRAGCEAAFPWQKKKAPRTARWLLQMRIVKHTSPRRCPRTTMSKKS